MISRTKRSIVDLLFVELLIKYGLDKANSLNQRINTISFLLQVALFPQQFVFGRVVIFPTDDRVEKIRSIRELSNYESFEDNFII